MNRPRHRNTKRYLLSIGLLVLGSAGDALAQQVEQSKVKPISLTSVNVTLPSGNATFPSGPGSQLVGYCLICHSAGMVTRQPALSKKQWEDIVNKMRDAYGAPVPEEQVEVMADYLVKNYGAKEPQK